MNAPQRNDRRIVRDIAHARAGDKGNTSNVSVWRTIRRISRC